MSQSANSINRASLDALSDLKAFFRSGADISRNVYKSEEESNATEVYKHSDVTRKALSNLLAESYSYKSELAKNKQDKEIQSNDTKTNPLQIDTQNKSALSSSEIKIPDAKQMQTNTSSLSQQQSLKINASDTETKPASLSFPKQKNTILNELRLNVLHQKYTAWDIARKYGISYIQAQEIFTELYQDNNGIVKEFSLPDNSTVSYLI